MKLLKYQHAGFTLVELLLYMGLLTIFITGLTSLFVASLETQIEGRAVSIVTQEGQFLLQRMEYDVYRADAILAPAAGNSSNSLALSIGGQTYTYQPSGDALELSINGVAEAMHREDLSLQNIVFTRVSDASTFDSLRISFMASSGASPARSSEERQFATTIGKR